MRPRRSSPTGPQIEKVAVGNGEAFGNFLIGPNNDLPRPPARGFFFKKKERMKKSSGGKVLYIHTVVGICINFFTNDTNVDGAERDNF